MPTSVADERVKEVRTTDRELIVVLADGRTLSVPLAWYPRLLNASDEQRSDWELIGRGAAISWPEIDEDLSVAGLLRAVPAPDANIQSSPIENPRGLKVDPRLYNRPAAGQPKMEETRGGGETEGSPQWNVRAALEATREQAAASMLENVWAAQQAFQGSMQQIQQQPQAMRQAGQALSEQAQGLLLPVQALAQESANAYSDLLHAATSLYQQGLQAWAQVTQQSLQAAGQATQQSLQAAGQVTQQTLQSTTQAAQQATQAAAEVAQESASAATNQAAQRSATSSP